MKLGAPRFGWRVAGVLILLLLLIGAFSIWRSRPEVVATLRTFAGQVERDHGATVGAWQGAPVGATFLIGDGLRTRPRSTATVELAGAHQLSLEPNTLIRFLTRPSDPKRTRVALEMGKVELTAADDALEFETELGAVRVEKHGRARLAREGEGLRLEVTIGKAEVDRDGKRWELSVGDAVEVSSTEPLRRVPAAAAASAGASAKSGVAATSDSAAANAVGSGAPSLAGTSLTPGLERVDLWLAAGESAVIHDPKPPTSVGVLASEQCGGTALLSIDAGKSHATERVGQGRVGVELTSGTHRYALQCLRAGETRGEKIGQGTISVVADAGLRKLADTAPLTKVQLDGRRYTVLYQGLLPKISLDWPNAPKAASYVLSVSSPKGTKTLNSSAPSYAFASGALAEGEHQLSFQAGAARSRQTTVVIRFDNAAPTASIASPADGSFTPGSSVLVAGTAQPGWLVTVGSETLAQDPQNRFSMQINAPAERALAIRFTKAQRGVHYYLRRSAF